MAVTELLLLLRLKHGGNAAAKFVLQMVHQVQPLLYLKKGFLIKLLIGQVARKLPVKIIQKVVNLL